MFMVGMVLQLIATTWAGAEAELRELSKMEPIGLGTSELLELVQIALALSALSLASAAFFAGQYVKAKETEGGAFVAGLGLFASVGAGFLSFLAFVRYFADFLESLGESGTRLLTIFFGQMISFVRPHDLLSFAAGLLALAIGSWSFALVIRSPKKG